MLFSEKSLMLCANACDAKCIKEASKAEIDLAEIYRNIVADGCEIVANSISPIRQ